MNINTVLSMWIGGRVKFPELEVMYSLVGIHYTWHLLIQRWEAKGSLDNWGLELERHIWVYFLSFLSYLVFHLCFSLYAYLIILLLSVTLWLLMSFAPPRYVCIWFTIAIMLTMIWLKMTFQFYCLPLYDWLLLFLSLLV